MGSHADRPVSRRRTRRAVDAPRARPALIEPTVAARWATRAGLLGALAAATLVIPVAIGEHATPVAEGAGATGAYPSTIEALAATAPTVTPPTSLLSSNLTAVRAQVAASRSEERSPLPGCSGTVQSIGTNGALPAASLCVLWDGKTSARADAAVAFAELNAAFSARFGRSLCLSSGYRTLAQQNAVKAVRGGLAASPGKSNHGLGLAVDLCSQETAGAPWQWLNENGPAFGWDNPSWARPGGAGPYERWHWEYTSGTRAAGTYFD